MPGFAKGISSTLTYIYIYIYIYIHIHIYIYIDKVPRETQTRETPTLRHAGDITPAANSILTHVKTVAESALHEPGFEGSQRETCQEGSLADFEAMDFCWISH